MPYVYRVRLHRHVGVLALVVSRLRRLRYDRDAGDAEAVDRPPPELPYAHLARYLPCTSEGARYAAWEDFAFSFMLIVATRTSPSSASRRLASASLSPRAAR